MLAFKIGGVELSLLNLSVPDKAEPAAPRAGHHRGGTCLCCDGQQMESSGHICSLGEPSCGWSQPALLLDPVDHAWAAVESALS